MKTYTIDDVMKVVAQDILKVDKKLGSQGRDARRNKPINVYMCDTSKYNQIATQGRTKRQLNLIVKPRSMSRKKLREALKGVATLHQAQGNKVIPIDTKSEDVLDTFYLRTFLERVFTSRSSHHATLHAFLCDNDDDAIEAFFDKALEAKNLKACDYL